MWRSGLNGSPRTVAFNVQGFRVAVNKHSGEIRILKSVQAADAGVGIDVEEDPRVAGPGQVVGGDVGNLHGFVERILSAAVLSFGDLGRSTRRSCLVTTRQRAAPSWAAASPGRRSRR